MTSLITPELVLMEHRDRLAGAERVRRIRHDPRRSAWRESVVVMILRTMLHRRNSGRREGIAAPALGVVPPRPTGYKTHG